MDFSGLGEYNYDVYHYIQYCLFYVYLRFRLFGSFFRRIPMFTIPAQKRALMLLLPLLAVLVIALVSASACTGDAGYEQAMPPVASGTVVVTPSASVPNDDPSIRGFITRITNSAESVEILVEYFAEDEGNPEYLYDKAFIRLDGNTAVDSDNGTIVTVSSLTVGSTVEVWFSEPSAESYPVLAYGQAVRLITSGAAINGLNGVPRLTVVGTSKSLAGVVEASWPSLPRDYSTTLREMLDGMRGAYVTAAPGSELILNLSTPASQISAAWSGVKTAYSRQHPLEITENNGIIIPQDAQGEIFVRVSAEWQRGSVVYGFSVSIVEPN